MEPSQDNQHTAEVITIEHLWAGYEHEAVLECAVVGRPDKDQLVKPKAFVVLREGARAGDALLDELKAFVRDRLAKYKYPRWIEFVEELPKSSTGKIQRYKLRQN